MRAPTITFLGGPSRMAVGHTVAPACTLVTLLPSHTTGGHTVGLHTWPVVTPLVSHMTIGHTAGLTHDHGPHCCPHTWPLVTLFAMLGLRYEVGSSGACRSLLSSNDAESRPAPPLVPSAAPSSDIPFDTSAGLA